MGGHSKVKTYLNFGLTVKVRSDATSSLLGVMMGTFSRIMVSRLSSTSPRGTADLIHWSFSTRCSSTLDNSEPGGPYVALAETRRDNS